ncbi:tyrosine-specific transport protein isoform X2 [Dioscorea cayenensis subsp. rotundata]|uniref:Tyrosine-specific transport protein isoform X2 n=1 Tax=Dioscorea cayennensis subsp. rotundata TaxID=55577 RepID=A0AB40BXZ1_DIOCR|nr:tyrosine-specific transport protein isoform X2 [Dioscorea cayenensis subsp. rotundata]XP_039132357.1 tyrosine-specific transport protein isoform X2 [Dioscorea cayenensis subsp. rotundata]
MILSHLLHFRTSSYPTLHSPTSPFLNPPHLLISLNPSKTLHFLPHFPNFLCKSSNHFPSPSPLPHGNLHFHSPRPKTTTTTTTTKSFFAAVSLIIGTAVGPGMLGLPSATILSGPLPSTLSILLSWLYVISSIILVSELSFAAMRHQNLPEVSFTSLATASLGPDFGAFVAVVYSCLSFSLLLACVSGISSLVFQLFPWFNAALACALAPSLVGVAIAFFPFNVIDFANRLLCCLMLVSITALVVFGLSAGRSSLLSSIGYASWSPNAILPAIPVTVLTLGFHVITPFVCMLLRDSMEDARKAILFGGFVPLAMVVSWNLVVLGLAGNGVGAVCVGSDPIKLLLSVNSSALPAVQGFAFAALATSLIGYAVSFPKQLADTLKLISERVVYRKEVMSPSRLRLCEGGRVGAVVYSKGKMGTSGQACFGVSRSQMLSNRVNEGVGDGSPSTILVMWIVLIFSVLIASSYNAAFSRALEFAGVYANCFLFGVLPPAMAWIHRSRKKDSKEELLPGGNGVLFVLFVIAIILGIWH